jgi:hypothetical protein
LLVCEARNVARHVGDWQAREQGDAVVSFLPVADQIPAGSLQFGARNLFVQAFDFLEAEYVYRIGGEPAQQVWQAHTQRIDVPGPDPHGVLVWLKA